MAWKRKIPLRRAYKDTQETARMTPEERARLWQEYLQRGGTVTQIAPGKTLKKK